MIRVLDDTLVDSIFYTCTTLLVFTGVFKFHNDQTNQKVIWMEPSSGL